MPREVVFDREKFRLECLQPELQQIKQIARMCLEVERLCNSRIHEIENDTDVGQGTPSKKRAALKRRTLDLSNALAEYRKRK